LTQSSRACIRIKSAVVTARYGSVDRKPWYMTHRWSIHLCWVTCLTHWPLSSVVTVWRIARGPVATIGRRAGICVDAIFSQRCVETLEKFIKPRCLSTRSIIWNRGRPERKTLDPMSRSSPKRHKIKTKNKTVKLKQTNKTMCKRCLRKKNQRISDVIPVPGTSSWFSESVTCLSVSHVINAFIHKSPSLVSCRGRFLTSALR